MMLSLRVVVSLCAALSAIASPIARQGCADVTVIFARGTTEPGTIGTIVGPPFEAALEDELSGQSLNFIGVPYAADIAGFLAGGDPIGSAAMAAQVASTAASCPNTAIVMAGYSQGAQLVHNAARLISASTASRVRAVVVFGDPDDGQQFANGLTPRSITFCNAGDNICAGGILILPPHLAYGANADDAARFVASRV